MGEENQSTGSLAKGLYVSVAVAVIVVISLVIYMVGRSSGPEQAAPAEETTQAPEPAPAPAPVMVTANIHDGVYTNAQARRGDKLYTEHCALCHLPSMTGKEPAPELAGDLFMSKWYGMSVGDLFIRISTTMPVSNPGILSEEQYSDLVTLLLQANNFRAGKEELKAEQDYMDGIIIQEN
jgi:mono/diheme cytochrome c family protein